jgi:hypothetical protein
MVRREYRVSAASRPILEPYAALPLNDPRRVALFSFLASVVAEPGRAVYEHDAQGLRWTWLEHMALVWRLDLVEREIDVIYAWDEAD